MPHLAVICVVTLYSILFKLKMDTASIIQVSAVGASVVGGSVVGCLGRRKAKKIKEQAVELTAKMEKAIETSQKVVDAAQGFMNDKQKQRVKKVKDRLAVLERNIETTNQILKQKSRRSSMPLSPIVGGARKKPIDTESV